MAGRRVTGLVLAVAVATAACQADEPEVDPGDGVAATDPEPAGPTEPDPDPDPDRDPAAEPEPTELSGTDATLATLEPLAEPAVVDLTGRSAPDGASLLGDPGVEVLVVPTRLIRVVPEDLDLTDPDAMVRTVAVTGGPVDRTVHAGAIWLEPTVDVDQLTVTYEDDGSDAGPLRAEQRTGLAVLWDDPDTRIVALMVEDVTLTGGSEFTQDELGPVTYGGPSPVLFPGFQTALQLGVGIDLADADGDRIFQSFDDVATVDVEPWRDLVDS